MDSNVKFENILSSWSFIPLKSIFERSCLKTNRVRQAKQRVKLFEEGKGREQRWRNRRFSTRFSFIRCVCRCLLPWKMNPLSVVWITVASFDTFRLSIERNSSIIEQRAVSPNYLSETEVNYSKDVPPWNTSYGGIYRSNSTLFGESEKVGN